MDEFWVRALVAVLAASCGVTTVVVVLVRRYCRRGAVRSAAGPCPEAAATCGTRPSEAFGPEASHIGGTSSTDRCEQAVLRAERAVDSISSPPLREGLCPVVRRMQAELPNVRALAELARGLESGAACAGGPRPAPSHAEPSHAGPSHAGPSRAGAVAERTREQLDNAASRFAGIADEVLETVADLADEPGPAPERVAALRERFPLTCSMSEVLGSSVPA